MELGPLLRTRRGHRFGDANGSFSGLQDLSCRPSSGRRRQRERDWRETLFLGEGYCFVNKGIKRLQDGVNGKTRERGFQLAQAVYAVRHAESARLHV